MQTIWLYQNLTDKTTYYLTEDDTVNNVINSFVQRSKAGMDKYGVTLKDNPENLVFWVKSLQEELMDATLYVERLLQEINEKEAKMSINVEHEIKMLWLEVERLSQENANLRSLLALEVDHLDAKIENVMFDLDDVTVWLAEVDDTANTDVEQIKSELEELQADVAYLDADLINFKVDCTD